MTITVRKDNAEHEFSSWNKAANFATGKPAQRNAKTCEAAIVKSGYEIIKVDASDMSVARSPRKTPIQYVIDAVSVVDTVKIKALETERLNIMKHSTTADEFLKVVEINKTIESLKTPSTTLETLLEYVKREWDRLEAVEEA